MSYMNDLEALAFHPLQQHALNLYRPNNSDLDGVMTMFFTLRAFYAPIKQHRLVCMPESFTKEPEARSRIHYTKGGMFPDIAKHGVGVTRFTISGTTGWDPVRVNDKLFIDGASAIKDLEETVASYMDPDSVALQVAAPIMFIPREELTLEFFNLDAATSKEDPSGACEYIIVPDQRLVRVERSSRKPFLWRYTFSFVAVEMLLSVGGLALGVSRMIADAVGGMPKEAGLALGTIAALAPGL